MFVQLIKIKKLKIAHQVLSELIPKLKLALEKPLPGKEGQIKMAPFPINETRFDFKPTADAQLGGVLLLLYEDGGKIKFPLTERATYDGVHSGQISFPGGKHEPEDVDMMATAKRETYEEIGVPVSDIHIIGKLTEMYIPPSNFHVHPYIGFVYGKPTFVGQESEVVKIIETDIDILLDEKTVKRKVEKMYDIYTMDIPYFDIDGHIVWGATAMILSEFKAIIRPL